MRAVIGLAVVLVFVAASVVQADSLAAAEVELLGAETPWRVFLSIAPPLEGTAESHKPWRNAKGGPSPLPPENWRAVDFDDHTWGRYAGELCQMLGGYGYRQSPEAALLCLRSRFGVSDPAKVRRLRLSITYRGGVAVFVNGREVGRRNLPPDALEPLTLAEDYPPEAYVMDDGQTPLPRADDRVPVRVSPERYRMRIRRLDVAIPGEILRRGANVLAVEIHRAANRRMDWATLGLLEIKLVAEGTQGLIPYDEAAGRLRLWNAAAMATITSRPQTGFYRTSWDRGPLAMSPAGLSQGNPFDPLGPVRMVAARNGVCSGQVVLGAAEELRDVEAQLGPLRSADGKTIPAQRVEVRYAVQPDAPKARYCDILLDRPAEGTSVQPIWVIVQVPRDQAPGWYTARLVVAANGTRLAVPVQVLVCAWTLPETKHYESFANLLHSPDTLALHYGVEPWSDEHFQLMDKSLAMLGQVGNDVALIPVVHHTHLGHRSGMVRFVQEGERYRPDFSALEEYLDRYVEHCGAPKVVCLILWKPQYGNRALFRGVRAGEREPVLVTGFDPATGRTWEFEAPAFGRPGSEAFWKPVLDGVRKIVRRRGWPERTLVLGQAFDSRPLPEVIEFFKHIAPDTRWLVFSHFNGDPLPIDGRLVLGDGLEVGYREEVAGGPLPALFPDRPELRERQFYCAGAHRIEVLSWSSPTAYRNLPNMTGTFCRIGLDFWPLANAEGGARPVFSSKICGPWLYKANPVALTAPGPAGPLPSVRFQMLREGVQETEARIFLVQSLAKVDQSRREQLEGLLDQRAIARRVARVLTQAQLSLDWLGLTAEEFTAAGELAGSHSTERWDAAPRPPQDYYRP